MSMRLIILLMVLVFSQVSIASVYERGGMFLSVEDSHIRPSCDVVKLRVQEFVRRSREADDVTEWYSPVGVDEAQKTRLLGILKRMPFFLDDRLYEHLTVRTLWILKHEDVVKYLMSVKTGVEIVTSKYNWIDPENGLFPKGVVVDLDVDEGWRVLTLEQKMSFEDFCLGDGEIKLEFKLNSFRGDRDTLTFKTQYDPAQLL